jgi:hypothetical protein
MTNQRLTDKPTDTQAGLQACHILCQTCYAQTWLTAICNTAQRPTASTEHVHAEEERQKNTPMETKDDTARAVQ